LPKHLPASRRHTRAILKMRNAECRMRL
jgi:hypothetical protein